MLLKEIKDPNVAATLGRFAKDYAPGGRLARTPKKSPEELEISRHHHAMDVAHRENAEHALKPIAQKYSGDQVEEFKQEAEQTIPKDVLQGVDLDSMFQLLNPDKINQSNQS